MYKKIVIFLIVILLSGCSKTRCVSSHSERRICYRYIYYYSNNKYRYLAVPYSCEKSVCDKWEEVQDE